MTARRPWPRNSRYLVGDDGTIVGPRGLTRGQVSGDGYRQITIRFRDGHRETHGMHVLVAETFLGPRPSPAHQVAHANNDRQDNRPENLRWATGSNNMSDRVRHGTNGLKLTAEDARTIRGERAAGVSRAELAARFGVSEGTISHIATGHSWFHLPGAPAPSSSRSRRSLRRQGEDKPDLQSDPCPACGRASDYYGAVAASWIPCRCGGHRTRLCREDAGGCGHEWIDPQMIEGRCTPPSGRSA
jgi:hypothetical protein